MDHPKTIYWADIQECNGFKNTYSETERKIKKELNANKTTLNSDKKQCNAKKSAEWNKTVFEFLIKQTILGFFFPHSKHRVNS